MDEERRKQIALIASIMEQSLAAGVTSTQWRAMVNQISEIVLSEEKERFYDEAWIGEITLGMLEWQHQLDPERCPCTDCQEMRNQVNRIKDQHE